MVSCIIINYNGEKFLPRCLESLRGQSCKELEGFFIDNASGDGSVGYVRRNFGEFNIVENAENKGYAAAANQGIALSRGEFVLIMNSDLVLEPDYLKILVDRMRLDAKLGSCIGKLRVYDFEHGRKTNLIDSAGLFLHRSRRCIDRGQGSEDLGQFDVPEKVFGVSGACALYRRRALEEVKICGEYFDEDFFMYKEDVDMAWRMRLFGWEALYEPAAIAFHGRGTGAIERSGLMAALRGRDRLSKFQRGLSRRNELLMKVKNEGLRAFFRDFLYIAWREFLMTGLMISRESFLWRSVFDFVKKLPRALEKRREIGRRLSERDSLAT